MPRRVWVVGELQAQPVVEHGCCTLLVATGTRGRERDQREIRVVGATAERVAALRRGTSVEVEANVVGAARTLVAHRVYALGA